MNRILLAGAAAMLLSGLYGALARAQDSVLAELYGQGVHAYFAGDYAMAHTALTSAITQGSTDPRCYFFRGLTYARLGRPTQASADLKKGAELEAGNTDRIYPVSDSLQRIQGRLRLQIERERQLARIAVRVKSNNVEQARYEQVQRDEQNVLRDPTRKPNGTVKRGTELPAPADTADPFAGGPEAKPEKAPEKPAAAAATPQPAASDPLSAPAPKAPAPAVPAKPAEAVDDPFGTPPATPPAAPAKPPAAADDPFGEAPAGAPPATAPPADAPPATAPPATAPPADAPPATAPPATAPPATAPPKEDANTDPFADEKPAAPVPADKPAEKPADASDPFGT